MGALSFSSTFKVPPRWSQDTEASLESIPRGYSQRHQTKGHGVEVSGKQVGLECYGSRQVGAEHRDFSEVHPCSSQPGTTLADKGIHPCSAGHLAKGRKQRVAPGAGGNVQCHVCEVSQHCIETAQSEEVKDFSHGRNWGASSCPLWAPQPGRHRGKSWISNRHRHILSSACLVTVTARIQL